jgi:hypothetical protein
MSPLEPTNMRDAYALSYRRAGQALVDSDPAEVCRHTGAVLNGSRIRVSYFGGRVEVELPDLGFSPEDLPLVERILVLHYLTSASGAGDAPGGPGGAGSADGNVREQEKLVAFKNLPGAAFYAVPYQKRGPARIARRFGTRADDFRRACSALGWSAESFGDLSYSFDVFPRVRGVVVLNLGDEEFPAEAAVLHNQGIVRFLPLEDIAVLGGLIATRLARAV